MKLEDHIAAWNYAAVKVLDIRHAVMEPGDKLQGYILIFRIIPITNLLISS
ncbi:hypothetical protein MKY19_11505 [Paenibacillus sp. FSL R5-0744]|uniref:hypothetical protein n=1 Tax=Paenibacillus sp. FSL R5-0744 TaxID=2921656 RepID=UPI0030DC8661